MHQCEVACLRKSRRVLERCTNKQQIFQSTKDTVAIRGFRAPILLRFVSAEPKPPLPSRWPKGILELEDYLKYIDVSRARRYLLGTERSLTFDIRGLVLFQMFQRSKHWANQRLPNATKCRSAVTNSSIQIGVPGAKLVTRRESLKVYWRQRLELERTKARGGCQRRGNARFVYDRETCGDWCGNATLVGPPQKTRDESAEGYTKYYSFLRACSRAGSFSLLCLLDLRVILDVNIISYVLLSAQKRANTHRLRVFFSF